MNQLFGLQHRIVPDTLCSSESFKMLDLGAEKPFHITVD